MPQVTVIASKIHQEYRLQVEVHPLIINHNVLNFDMHQVGKGTKLQKDTGGRYSLSISTCVQFSMNIRGSYIACYLFGPLPQLLGEFAKQWFNHTSGNLYMLTAAIIWTYLSSFPLNYRVSAF